MTAAHSLISGTKLSSSPAFFFAFRSSRGLSLTEAFSHAACSGPTVACAFLAFCSSDMSKPGMPLLTFSSKRGISSVHMASTSSAVGGARLASAVRASIFACVASASFSVSARSAASAASEVGFRATASSSSCNPAAMAAISGSLASGVKSLRPSGSEVVPAAAVEGLAASSSARTACVWSRSACSAGEAAASSPGTACTADLRSSCSFSSVSSCTWARRLMFSACSAVASSRVGVPPSSNSSACLLRSSATVTSSASRDAFSSARTACV
eukprot:scaffold98683_cov47-Phaeocystis_antarctica.AAC.3